MRVVVLGGAGGMGSVASREAAAYSFVEKVTIADANAFAARRLAQMIGTKADAVQCDVNDPAALQALLGDHDVVLNTVGPFYRFGVPVLKAAIAAGRLYADICDDWEPTLEMLELDGEARSQGATALLGMGASPGITNLLAKMIGSKFERVDELFTGWSIEGSDEDQQVEQEAATTRGSEPAAAYVHWAQQLTGKIRQFEGGQMRDVKPLQKRVIKYPGYGDLPIWTVGHPEAVTLPRIFPELKTCANVMVGENSDFKGLKMITGLVNLGALSIEKAASYLAADSRSVRKARTKGKSVRPKLFAWAKGTRDGRAAVASAHMRKLPAGGMGGATSVPLALTLPFFRDGHANRPGVHTPEQILDPTAFLDRLAPRCLGGSADMGALVEQAFEYVG